AFKEASEDLLAAAACSPGDIDFFCIHQGAPWMRQLVQDYLGLGTARSVETFARTGYVFASTLPIALAAAQEEAVLSEDDLVMVLGGGPGATHGGTILR